MTAETRLGEITNEIEETGDLTNVEELIALSPDGVNWRTPMTGDSLLHLAAQQGNTQLASRLIQMGADPNARSARGHTALHYAAKHRDTAEIVQLLLASGARCDLLDEDSQNALYVAARRENLEFIHLVLRTGIPIDLRSVARLGWFDVALTHFETNRSQGIDLRLLLDDAVKSNCVPLVRLVLDKGANPNGEVGRPPLLIALRAETPNPAIVEVLLERGANPLAVDAFGRSLVSLAMKMADAGDQHETIFRQIIDLFSRFNEGT